MQAILLVLLILVAADDAMADMSREDKLMYIAEAENIRGQIIAYQEEVANKIIDILNKDEHVSLDSKAKNIISEEIVGVVQELVEDYIEDIVDVYATHLTDQEVNAFYSFYQTSEGKSLGSKMPEINRNVFWVDARYIETLSKRSVSRIEERLTQEGYD